MMMLDLVGGEMKPAPVWALSVAELEQLGLDERSARHVAGVSPGFELDGRWVLLVDDEPYDAATTRVIEIRGAEAIDRSGRRGRVERWRRFALLRFASSSPSELEQCVVLSTALSAESLAGMAYWGDDLPAGDPGELWDDDAEDLPMAEPVWFYREDTVG
ncbi:hypothetical protein [Sphingomonas sp. S2-65]|uniref:hypothetical protein n=1 Tax=Sphingomonas sp. S2-65 TaxID=2903960 RepID=UPI001F2C9A6F|nr:hypothetical protein [Sphingomonas sp. S2-65]UYY60080.1 hypothetical protein LZ586_08390 [Sphingomonas sp. S2-65]